MRLTTHQLCKRMRFRTILSDVEIALEPGEIVTLLGANGTGKTTLLRLLGTVYSPTKGEIRIDGELLNRRRLDLRRRLHLLPDIPENRLPISVVEYIVYTATLYGVPQSKIDTELLSLLEKWDLLVIGPSWIGQLSRGQSYKAHLAALELSDPELWLLDEPFASGMDPSGLYELRRTLKTARDRGRTILFSTQLVELAQTISDRVIMLDGSKVAAIGSLDELLSPEVQSQQPAVAKILQSLSESSHE